MDVNERYSRQRDIVPAQRLKNLSITIIGVGALGRQLAIQLAAMGAPKLQLIDFDTVEDGNLASQGYHEIDLGSLKVNATARLCQLTNSSITVDAAPERFRRSMAVGDVVFAAVDAISTRELIWNAVKDRTTFFGDGRMTAEVIRVLTAGDAAGRRHYPTTLFAQEEAFTGACTSKMTIFTANIAAGLLLSQFSRWLRGLPTDPDLTLNLLSSEMTAMTEAPCH
ncbi:MAG: ThiF family adenylyltransferase [Planctomycetaceae bacterium]|nr:ThiF family adenylyltransferase [Planctomycetaceae bacterium]